MKNLIRNLALFSLLIFGCTGLMGQKSLLVQDIQPTLSYSSDISTNIILSADNSLNSYQFYLEDKIQLKDWMISKEGWFSRGGSGLASDKRVDLENELRLENWMLGSLQEKELWLSALVKEETEEPVKLQDWMLCCEEWQAESL